jgi:hypothetical protein
MTFLDFLVRHRAQPPPVDEDPVAANAPLQPGDLILIHAHYDDYPGIILNLYPETGRARVRFYDWILDGGCWREIGVDTNRLSLLQSQGRWE